MAAVRSGFGSRSTAEQVTEGVDLSGLTAIVTGATSGIGTETARVLALRGAIVYITGRSVESATAIKDSIHKEMPNAKVDILAPLDLNSQASIRKSAEKFLSLNQPLNLLINNAGFMNNKFELTEDRIANPFGVNHIGHFLLTNLLLQRLKETANETGIESRIVNVSSLGILFAPRSGVDWENINDKTGFGGLKCYGISKLANVYHAQELTRRLQDEGATNVTINAVHPGSIRTNLDRNFKCFNNILYAISFPLWKSIPQGAATTCYVAVHPSLKGVSGKFFNNNNEVKATKYYHLAEDEEAAKKLWDVSAQLTST